jgi:hypothetical protein
VRWIEEKGEDFFGMHLMTAQNEESWLQFLVGMGEMCGTRRRRYCDGLERSKWV